MRRFSLPLVALVFLSLSLLAAETKPADTKPVAGKAEAKVDKTLDKYKNKEPRIWAEVDYYGLFSLDAKRPGFALVTSQVRFFPNSNPNKPGFIYYGELDSPTVRVLYDKDEESYGWSHGFKGAIGGWLDSDEQWGAELHGFVAPSVSSSQTRASGAENYMFSVPFSNSQMGYEDAVLLGHNVPGFPVTPASVKIASEQGLWGIGVRGLRNVVRDEAISLDATFGFRNLNLSEEFAFSSNSTHSIPDTTDMPYFLSGATIRTGTATFCDSVKTANHFYGADLGVLFSFTKGRFILDVRPQLALGAMDESIETRGSSRIADAAGATLFTSSTAGFFARPGSTGERSKMRFAAIPDVSVKVGVKFNEHLQFKAGYEFLYISDVVRAGNQLDRRLNLPRTARGVLTGPATGVSKPFRTDDFMAHGVTAGFTIKF